MKRTVSKHPGFSLVFGAVLSLISLPLAVLIALFVKLETKGPIFYFQERLGQGGRLFVLFKFRTMHLDAGILLDEYLQSSKVARYEWETFNKLKTHDPRLTRTGRFLRKYSLDELPQVLNLLFGQMCLVGPRPYLPAEKKQMGKYGEIILTIKPGLTGLWQVSGRNRIDFRGRLELDAWYVQNRSPWLDMKILLKTPGAVLQGEGA